MAELYLSGGDAWQQGDWLISNAAGPVRRGISGSVLIWVSDSINVNLLAVVMATQILVFLAYGFVIAKKSLEIGLSDRVLILLLSPAFIGFYVNDFQAAFRKESIALLAFLPLLYASESRQKSIALAAITALIYGFSLFAHEANIFLLPFLLAGIWLSVRATGNTAIWATCAAAVLVAAVAAFFFAINNTSVDDVAPICQAVVERGLGSDICDGAISFVGNSVSDTTEFVVWLLQSQNQTMFVQSYMLAFVPIFLVLKGTKNRVRLFLIACATSVIFLPLYFVTIDWGRWLYVNISAVTLILLIAARFGLLPRAREPLPMKGYVAMLFFCAAWGISHVGGGLRGGYPVTVERVVKGGLATYLGIGGSDSANVGFDDL